MADIKYSHENGKHIVSIPKLELIGEGENKISAMADLLKKIIKLKDEFSEETMKEYEKDTEEK